MEPAFHLYLVFGRPPKELQCYPLLLQRRRASTSRCKYILNNWLFWKLWKTRSAFANSLEECCKMTLWRTRRQGNLELDSTTETNHYGRLCEKLWHQKSEGHICRDALTATKRREPGHWVHKQRLTWWFCKGPSLRRCERNMQKLEETKRFTCYETRSRPNIK